MEQILTANCWRDFEDALLPLEKTTKGRIFEELTRLHLEAEPTFSVKFENLWHHSELPQEIIDELGLQRPEIGVDLVAEIKDGSFWAIQSKFHQDRTRNVTYDELSTFFSITERSKTFSKLSHRLICTSANGVSHKVNKAHPEKIGYLTSAEFSKLGHREFDIFRDILNRHPPTLEPHKPYPHQINAVKRGTAYFADPMTCRGKIIHPCGSGKSLTGYWLSEALKAKKILIAVPSLGLIRQTLAVWAKESVAKQLTMDWIAVCSDESVSKIDDPALHTTDLGIDVHTNPDRIADFLLRPSQGTKVVLTTYQSGRALSDAVKQTGTLFDIGIFDEAHKTVGRKDKAFSHLLYDENIQIKKRVFLTATEREFKGNSNDINSMDDASIYGKVIDHLSFKQALEQDPPILCDYKIVTTFVTKAEIEQLLSKNKLVKSNGKEWSFESDASTLAALISLRKLVNAGCAKHILSFHNSIARAKDFKELNAELIKIDPSFKNLNSFHISGKDSIGYRASELERFVNISPSLMTNARCLNEGVDVPAIDAVLFADPKQSKVDIVQAAGRAMRKSSGKNFGYIAIPVIIDGDQETDLDKAFNQIITVISALGMSDERIIDEFKNIVAGKKSSGIIEILDAPEATAVDFKDFSSSLGIRIWDRLSFAKSVIGESNFTQWMRETTSLSEKSIKNYTQAVRKISNDLVRRKLAYSSLDELMSTENPTKLKEEYFAIAEYKELDARGNHMYSSAFNKLIEYHQSKHAQQ